ncbi:3'-5' exonuclease [Roseibium sp.]|uniref:3'-5' exonuclease n=1 Tax=Roseibium sp. TaxID=1936156 RepID=UPI003B51DAC1
MLLFFDTETTGLYQSRLPHDHQDQPHLVQLAAFLTDDEGNPEAEMSVIINPGVPIPDGASNVHGITTEKAERLGCEPDLAINMFRHLYLNADRVIAHNISFDKGVMEVAIGRMLGAPRTMDRDMFCTMEAATPIVNLPPTERMIAAGMNKPKPPKLEECIRHFFDEELDGAHDAMVDVRACKRLYFRLAEEGVT